jgi:hypothetical protein
MRKSRFTETQIVAALKEGAQVRYQPTDVLQLEVTLQRSIGVGSDAAA